MSMKEVLPAFIWAGVIVGATSLALAWISSAKDDYSDYSNNAALYVSPFDH